MRNRRARRRKAHQRSKDHAELVHFQNRCLERVGSILSQKKLKEVIFGCPHDDVFLAKQSLRTSKWLYTHTDGREFIVVYDKHRHRFVTIMPRAWDHS